MQTVVNICLYAEGYNSGSTYEENIMVSEEFFDKIKEQLDNFDFYKDDLDGKYSEVLAERDYQYFTEEDILDWTLGDLESRNDDNIFYLDILTICEKNNLSLGEECKRVKEWCKERIKKVKVTYEIPVSKKAELDRFVQSLLE